MLAKASNRLDSIANLIKADSIKVKAHVFEDKNQTWRRIAINPQKGTTLFEKSNLIPPTIMQFATCLWAKSGPIRIEG